MNDIFLICTFVDDDSEDEEKFQFFANPKRRKYNTDNESISDKDNEEEDEDDGEESDPATRFRRGAGLPDDFDENTEDSIDHLINEDLEDEREYVAMGSAIEREFLSDK